MFSSDSIIIAVFQKNIPTILISRTNLNNSQLLPGNKPVDDHIQDILPELSYRCRCVRSSHTARLLLHLWRIRVLFSHYLKVLNIFLHVLFRLQQHLQTYQRFHRSLILLLLLQMLHTYLSIHSFRRQLQTEGFRLWI